MFRIKLAVLTAATIATASVGLAIPAFSSTTVTIASDSSVSGGPVSGTTVTIVNNSSTNEDFTSNDLSTFGSLCTPCRVNAGATRTYDIAPGTSNVSISIAAGSFTVTYDASGGGGGGGSSSSSSASSGPAPIVQQFGMPATGTCDEAQPEGLNWSGVANGGWGVSWAQWMNGGTGGAVCTRTLVYSTDQSKWIVN